MLNIAQYSNLDSPKRSLQIDTFSIASSTTGAATTTQDSTTTIVNNCGTVVNNCGTTINISLCCCLCCCGAVADNPLEGYDDSVSEEVVVE